jgi:hypothetical protein
VGLSIECVEEGVARSFHLRVNGVWVDLVVEFDIVTYYRSCCTREVSGYLVSQEDHAIKYRHRSGSSLASTISLVLNAVVEAPFVDSYGSPYFHGRYSGAILHPKL